MAFYRDTLSLSVLRELENTISFEFGSVHLHVERADRHSHPDIWFELITEDVAAGKAYLDQQGVQRRDEIEKLPDGFNGFWVCNPASVTHLVCDEE